MENRNISDAHFNASSEQDQLSLAKYGRLNNVYEENVKYVHSSKYTHLLFKKCNLVDGNAKHDLVK